MAKKRKKKSFADKHPFITLTTFPISAPILLASSIAKETKKRPKTKTAQITKKPTVPNQPVYYTGSAFSLSGLQYEHYVANRLRAEGCTYIQVTPGSGDFGADIICLDPYGRRICVQCKKYRGTVGVKAVQEVIGAKEYYGCQYGICITTSTFTQAAKNMAAKTGIILRECFY